jgi:hypothetical protein
VEHSLQLISVRKHFSAEDLAVLDHYFTVLIPLASARGNFQEAATIALTYYPVHLDLPNSGESFSVSCPAQRALDTLNFQATFLFSFSCFQSWL